MKPGPKPGLKSAALLLDLVRMKPPEPVVPRPKDPLQRHRDINTMPEAELRAYARQLGMSVRDAESLGVERLRANCLHMIFGLLEIA